MGQLIVRNLDDRIIQALKERAVRNRRSAEAEHREILEAVLGQRPGPSFKEFLTAQPDGLTEDDLERDRSVDRQPAL